MADGEHVVLSRRFMFTSEVRVLSDLKLVKQLNEAAAKVKAPSKSVKVE